MSEASVSAINLAIEKPDACFLSDDDNVRLYAINIGLNVIGTTRVIADAAVQGKIKSLEELAEALYELKSNNYPINAEMISDIVKVVQNRIKLIEEKQKNEKETDFINKVHNTIKKIEESNTPKEPFSLFGIEHDFGWYGLTLPIIEEVRLYNIANPDNEIQISQIKEKFGSLSIYLSGAPDYLKAGHESQYICEICGARGKNEEINGWYRTLCEEHKKARIDSKGDHELADRLYKKRLDIRNYGWQTYEGE